tara:strand:+ start:115 stop:273 length:159 start_codon:yes stop_codon:yes gene_type:complete
MDYIWVVFFNYKLKKYMIKFDLFYIGFEIKKFKIKYCKYERIRPEEKGKFVI